MCVKASACKGKGVYIYIYNMSKRLCVNASVCTGICVQKLLCLDASAASV